MKYLGPLESTFERFGFDARAIRVAWTALAIYLLYVLRGVLFVFLIAILLAYTLLPVVNFVDRHFARQRRAWALAVVYLALLAAIGGIGFVVGGYAVTEAGALAADLQSLASSTNSFNFPVPGPLRPLVGQANYDIRPWLASHGQELLGTITGLTFKVLGLVGSVANTLVVLVLSYFFLAGGETMASNVLSQARPDVRERLTLLVTDMNVLLAQYMRALVSVAAITGVLYGIGFSLMGVPYAVLLAVVALPFEFIPTIGPLISTFTIVAVAALSGYPHLLRVLAFIGVIRLIQDYVIQPRLMGHGVQLSPLAIMFGVFAGQEIGGIAGAVISVPTLAALRILYRHFVQSDQTRYPEAGETVSRVKPS